MARTKVTAEAVGTTAAITMTYPLAKVRVIETSLQVTVGDMNGEWVPNCNYPPAGLLPNHGCQFVYSISKGVNGAPDSLVFTNFFVTQHPGLAIVATYTAID